MAPETEKDGSAAGDSLLRALPSVDALLAAPTLAAARERYRHSVLLRLAREVLEQQRQHLKQGAPLFDSGQPSRDFLLEQCAASLLRRLAQLEALPLRRVINGSGVLIHTNLGRAVLTQRAREALGEAATGYCNLELDLESGERSRRDVTLEPLLCALTGAESATVVNNNAAAVYLILHTLAGHGAEPASGEVIASRGELVEIGGSYRVPDMLRASGCHLIEVGTTNRTRLRDYERALSEHTALLLKTHPSNYRIVGFTEECSIEELAALGQRRNIPCYFDLGSGYLAPEGAAEAAGLPEPDISTALAAGADLLSFSGDKLLGGPQAGIILGRRELIARLRQSPLWRALRVDKFTAAALAATLLEHLRQPLRRSPGGLLAQLALSPTELRQRAEELRALLTAARPDGEFSVIEHSGGYGGGSLPEESIASFAVRCSLPGSNADALDQRLRRGDPPLVGVFDKGYYCINVLTLLDGDAEATARAFVALERPGSSPDA